MHLAPGRGQNPPVAIAQLAGQAYQLNQQATGHWTLAVAPPTQVAAGGPESSALAGLRLTNLAPSLGLDFQQGAFRYGMSSDTKAMMGGGVCWLDYNNDGWQDLFAVNSYASADAPQWEAHGGLPRTALFENVDGTFKDVSADTHAESAVQGDGCAAADLNGDGHTDLVVTTTSGVDVLWNTGHGTFTDAQLPANGWYTGVAVADVNGDGRPDLFVAGYSDLNQPVQNSLAGFPTNVAGVRDLLYLNERSRALQRGRRPGRPRGRQLPPRARRDVHRCQRRRPPGHLRRERRGPEPALRQRPVARRRERRSGRARLPLRGARGRRRRRRPVRRNGSRDRASRRAAASASS